MFEEVADIFSVYDHSRGDRVPEDVVRQVLWSALAFLPGFAEGLGLREDLVWYSGKRGCGDLTGVSDGAVLVHFEVKGYRTQNSYGVECPNKCGEYRSQLQHMAEDKGAAIVLATFSGRVEAWKKKAEALGLGERVRVTSFSAVAEAIKKAVGKGKDPGGSLLASMFDVELPVAARLQLPASLATSGAVAAKDS